jgi:hypothetical protein
MLSVVRVCRDESSAGDKRFQIELDVQPTRATILLNDTVMKVMERRDYYERQTSRCEPTERPQKHRPQDAGG